MNKTRQTEDTTKGEKRRRFGTFPEATPMSENNSQAVENPFVRNAFDIRADKGLGAKKELTCQEIIDL